MLPTTVDSFEKIDYPLKYSLMRVYICTFLVIRLPYLDVQNSPRKPLQRGHHKPLHHRQGVKSVKTKVGSGKISEREKGTDYNDNIIINPTHHGTDNDIIYPSTELPPEHNPGGTGEWGAWGACNATGSTVQLETNLRKNFTINF